MRDATFERRAGDHEGAIAAVKREPGDRAMWDFVKSKPPPSARGSVTVRRPDGTTITCDVAQLQDVLEQAHKVRPRPIEITCTADFPSLSPLTDGDPEEVARNLGISLTGQTARVVSADRDCDEDLHGA